MTDYTDKERRVIAHFDVGFNYRTADQEISDNATALSVEELAERTGMTISTVKGVVGSLVKKDILVPWDDMEPGIQGLYVTEEGINAHYDRKVST